MRHLEHSIFQDFSVSDFTAHALLLFRYQYEQNSVYRDYCDKLSVDYENVFSLDKIPFLPISFFKTQQVVTTNFKPEIVFSSSGTTGMSPSHHYVKKLALYEKSFLTGFKFFYGDPSQYTFLALLPGYLERENSSLIYMIKKFIEISGSPDSGFFLNEYDNLYKTLVKLQFQKKKVILFGVSFALLDFAEKYQFDFPELLVFETGGMKGLREELVKEELHDILKTSFGVPTIHSEYGMCELLSQAYSCGNNIFKTPPWMKLFLRDEKDPLFTSPDLTTGVINVIDLANVFSCAFIATDDLGRQNDSGMELLGRLDSAEVRGCNLLVM
jgi:phenylacetate-coenzyme A ligase PaaK-like adenylate-forming protein